MEIVNYSSMEQLNNPLKPVGLPDNRFADPHIKIFTNPDSGRQAMYIYVGHDEGKGEFIMRNWYVLWSEDLIHWNAKVSLDRKDTFMDPESVNCWACDCVQSPFDNRFYLYYSNGRDSTGVAVSDRPDGPFTDARGKTPLLTANEQLPCAYDPDIILPDKDDPNAYIVFCGSWQAPYWSMQLKQNMTEVVPGTLRRVYVYPADGTPEELTGELRSDQPEAFRYGDTWYMYWAGRYATGKNRLGPYTFRSDIGKEIPHYPDGRCFIDHGSFLEWNGQWFYAVSHGTEFWSYRQIWLLYVHMCDDGTLMLDETIRRCGVGQYCAEWDKIEAEWYMRLDTPALRKIELQQNGVHQGFAIAQTSGTQCAHYPHVYGMQAASRMTLRLCGEAGAQVEVLIDSTPAGTLTLQNASTDFTELSLSLQNTSGEHDLTLRLTGKITVDWFRLTAAEC